MKRMTPMKRWFRVLPLAILPFLFFNCSNKTDSLRTTAGAAGYPVGPASAVPSSSTTSFEVLSDNTIRVYQDKELNFSPTSAASGVYTLSARPAWVTSFDVNTGTIVGIPHKLSDTGTFTIQETTTNRTYGPYTVTVVGDALKEQQWHLLNSGQKSYAFNSGTAGEDLHMGDSVKDHILGIGVRVAISDTGTVLAHPDLVDNILPGESRNYFNNYATTRSWAGDPTPAASDIDSGHGTAVAGLFAAKGWNGIGGRGAAPESRFASFLFLPAQDQLSKNGYLDMALYDQFAGNFDIFNYSWGDPQCMLTEYASSFTDKLRSGVTSQRRGLGSIYMLASGNSFVEDLNECDPNIPAGNDLVLGNNNFSETNTTPYTINVSAVNADGLSASYATPGSANWISSTGGEFGQSTQNTNAPENSQPALVTTDYPGCNNGVSWLHKLKSMFDAGAGNLGCSYTNSMNGTSGATPIAGGVVAMMLQANPRLTWRDVKYILAKTADKIDPSVNIDSHPYPGSNLTGHIYEQGWITNAAGFHFQNWYGFGRINADNAVAMAKTYTLQLGTFKTTGFKYNSGAVSLTVPDASEGGLSQMFNVTDTLALEAVQLRVSINSCVSDMGLELTSPGGTKSILLNINNRLRDPKILNHIFLSNAFYGESSVGTWTLKVIDGKSSCVGQLTNWQLNFFGH